MKRYLSLILAFILYPGLVLLAGRGKEAVT